MGDAVNLAARVMSKAGPGEILATEPVLAASRVRFETQALEPFTVKGKKQPVVARRVGKVLGSFRTDDLDALRLVGREPELDALRTALERTTAGRGQLVEIVGEAGIGKSRLLQEVKTFAPDDMPWHTVACARYEASTPYFPFRPLLRALLGIVGGPRTRPSCGRLRSQGRAGVPRADDMAASARRPTGSRYP